MGRIDKFTLKFKKVMGIKCSKCSFENPDGFIFSRKCGSKLVKEKKAERKRVSVMFVDVCCMFYNSFRKKRC